MKLARLGLAILISFLLIALICPLAQAYDPPHEEDEDSAEEVGVTVTLTAHSLPVSPPYRPGGGVGGGGGAGGFIIAIIMDGKTSYYTIGREGKIKRAITATSEDGNLTLTSPAHTVALDEDGERLKIVEVTVGDTPACPPPENAYIIGLPRSFEPSGATFDPPITLEYTYDPADIPEGVAEEDLVLAYCDEETEKWVALEDFEVDTVNNIITARLSHFTTLAILGFVTPPAPPPPAPAAFTSSSLSIFPPEVDIGQTVTISVLVANTGEVAGTYTVTLKVDRAVEATEEITLAGGTSNTVVFTTSQDEAGTYSVDVDGLTGSFTVKEAVVPLPVPTPAPTPPSKINWAILGPIIGAAVFLAIFLPIRQRRRRLLQ